MSKCDKSKCACLCLAGGRVSVGQVGVSVCFSSFIKVM